MAFSLEMSEKEHDPAMPPENLTVKVEKREQLHGIKTSMVQEVPVSIVSCRTGPLSEEVSSRDAQDTATHSLVDFA